MTVTEPDADRSEMSTEQLDTLALVIDLIRAHGHITRPELVRRAGLGRAVVTQRVSELIDLGVAEDGDPAPSTGGRPAREIRIRADAGSILAAELGATSISVALSDLACRTRLEREEPMDVAAGPEACLAQLERLFDGLLSHSQDPCPPLWGIGVGLPGPVEFATGRPIAPPIMPGWDDYPVRERLRERHGVPVWVDNEVNVMALGELRAGLAAGERHALYVKIGTGIGAGLISNGRLHRGAQGCAGSLTSMAGAEALLRQAAIVAAKHPDGPLSRLFRLGQPRVEDLLRLAEEGDAASVGLLREAAEDVGRTIAVCVDFFNPSLVVISGGLGSSGDRFLAEVRKVVYGNALALATRDLQIRPSPLGPDAGVLGAAQLALDGAFTPDRMAATVARLVTGQARGVDTP